MLYSHGNSEDMGPQESNGYYSEWYNANYVSYDYTGYGYARGEGESGQHSEEHVYNDAEAVYNYVIKDMGVDPATLILYGRSLGSGPAIHLATKYPQGAAGLVLESALLSIVRTQCGCCVVDEKSWETDLFCNIDKCEKIKCPTLVMHGTRDCIVPHWHGRRLQARIPNAVEPIYLKKGHNDIWDGSEAHYRTLMRRVNKFMRFCLRQRRQADRLLSSLGNVDSELKGEGKEESSGALDIDMKDNDRAGSATVGVNDIELIPVSGGNAGADESETIQEMGVVTSQPNGLDAEADDSKSANVGEKDKGRDLGVGGSPMATVAAKARGGDDLGPMEKGQDKQNISKPSDEASRASESIDKADDSAIARVGIASDIASVGTDLGNAKAVGSSG